MTRPERFITVWCPDWPVVAAGRGKGGPAAVVAAHRIVARSDAAAAEGVVVGQRRRQAQSRCPSIELIEHDPARDAREFEAIVRAVVEIAPRVDVVEPGWISLAARGPSRYFGGDLAVADHLVSVVTAVAPGVSVGVGVADGRFTASVAARLAVRRGAPVVVEPGGSAPFCAPLSIGWLQTLGDADADLVDLFVRLGLRRLGELAALSASDVLGRFGHAGAHAHRLASGLDERTASTDDPPPERRLARSFDDPVAQSEAVVFVAKQLADELAGRLAADGRVCTRLVVQIETEHGERSERSWYRSTGLPASAMVERVRWQLDAWMRQPLGTEDRITSGVALVRLIPDEVRADDGEQLGLWGGQSDADRRAGRAIARLTTITSERAVTVPVWQGGRLPSERYRWTPATTVDLDGRGREPAYAAVTGVGVDAAPVAAGSIFDDRAGARRSAAGHGSGGVGAGSSGAGSSGASPGRRGAPWPGSLPPPSPATVYDTPLPIEVLDDEGRPLEVSGRGVVTAAPASVRRLSGDEASGWRRGPTRTVRAWAGPWPVDQRWWEPGAHRRLARFQLVVDGTGSRPDDGNGSGQHAILVVAEHRRWWLAARYD